jgi:NAD(P)-dependent dehydrogenase (short-subunit alcohol dehydrogenase family)
VADAKDVRRWPRNHEQFGVLDVLVNNAGSIVERVTLEEITEEL